jgi:dTDP-4-dehydrorhamnose 3,5-epimerase
MTSGVNEPRLIEGGLAVDDRGRLAFVNSFDMTGIKRFYAIANHRAGIVRAWHGHKVESKYFFMISGALLVATVTPDNWEHPSSDLPVKRFVLSADKPALFYVPAGCVHGHMSLTDDTRVLVLSTTTLEESLGDDYRYEARFWDCWHVVER